MESKQWVEMHTKGDHPGHLQSSAMCLVAYQERKTLRLDKLSEIQWHLVTEKISLEGIFVFGGIKGEVPDMKLKDNNLYRLSIGDKNHTWSIVETSGPQPEARYQHSMHFIKASNLIILVGGRRLQDMSFSTDHDAEFIKDTHILDMRSLEWSIIKF